MSSKPTPVKAKSLNIIGKQDDRLQGNPAVYEGWAQELQDRIEVFQGDIDKFLNVFVPSLSDPPPTTKLGNVFKKWKPKKGKEKAMYPMLLDAFDTLATPIPSNKRISFSDCSDYPIPFPFAEHADNHHETKPDVTVSFPGRTLKRFDMRPNWQEYSMVMEAKATADEDPFPKLGAKHVKTVIQLAISARNLHIIHGFLTSFVVGIYGGTARIARFDHSGAVVSQPFDYRKRPDVFRRFFWRFVHPCIGDSVVGADPAISKLTRADVKWVRERMKELDWPVYPSDSEMLKGRRVTIPEGDGSRTKSYVLFDLVDVNTRLFSRATTVWLALEDWRGALETAPEKELVIYKETWRQVVRRPEAEFYVRLEAIPNDLRCGLARMVCGRDVGIQQVDEFKASGKELPKVTEARTSVDEGAGKASTSKMQLPSLMARLKRRTTRNSMKSQPSPNLLPSDPPPPAPSFALPYPQYQTYMWRLLSGEKLAHRERSLVRFVVDAVGRPLTRFRSTRELVEAMRDAIAGHQQAWEVGVLHRDVSAGNILITERAKERLRGFLHDFDYSSMTKNIPSASSDDLSSSGDNIGKERAAEEYGQEGKERTGTPHFMAIHILRGSAKTHCVHHDLESFYWVLLWVVLRHTKCDFEYGTVTDAYELAFKMDRSYVQTSLSKEGSLSNVVPPIVVDNAPLTSLLESFRTLCRTQMFAKGDNVPLTHEAVLKIFDDALAMEGWPTEGDSAMKFVPEKTTTIDIFGEKRKTEDAAAEQSRRVRSRKNHSAPALLADAAEDESESEEKEEEARGNAEGKGEAKARPTRKRPARRG